MCGVLEDIYSDELWANPLCRHVATGYSIVLQRPAATATRIWIYWAEQGGGCSGLGTVALTANITNCWSTYNLDKRSIFGYYKYKVTRQIMFSGISVFERKSIARSANLLKCGTTKSNGNGPPNQIRIDNPFQTKPNRFQPNPIKRILPKHLFQCFILKLCTIHTV